MPDPTTHAPEGRAPPRRGRPPGSFAAHPTRRVQEQLVLRAAGFSLAQVATLFGISRQAVSQAVRRWSGRPGLCEGRPPSGDHKAPLT